jgi:hypothetical protein
MRGADGVEIAVFRKGPVNLEFIRAAAHFHVMCSYQIKEEA